MRYGIAYAAFVISCAVAFLSGLCLVRGNTVAVIPLAISVLFGTVLMKVVDRYERGDRG